MPSCPSGHDSTAFDFCDVCGTRLQTDTPAQSPGARPTVAPRPPVPAQRPPGSEPRGGPCPECRTPRAGRFCEECGHDFASHTGGYSGADVPGRAVWRVVVAADPAYYQYMVDQDMLDPDQLTFPSNNRQRRITLTGDRVHIGRRSASRGFTPEIDLGGPGGDPAISQNHAILLSRPGDRWTILDPGSTNGTAINGTGNPITPNVEVPLNDSDRIYVGAWTVIILYRG